MGKSLGYDIPFTQADGVPFAKFQDRGISGEGMGRNHLFRTQETLARDFSSCSETIAASVDSIARTKLYTQTATSNPLELIVEMRH